MRMTPGLWQKIRNLIRGMRGCVWHWTILLFRTATLSAPRVRCSKLLYHPLRNKSKSLSSFSHKAMD
jgi:hypothetical protein